VAFVFGVVAAVAAHTKGRNSLGWFIAGLLIGPFSLLVSMLPNIPREGQFKRCSVCSEVIREDAKLCRFCGRESLSESTTAQTG
jgi:hypothetical protein